MRVYDRSLEDVLTTRASSRTRGSRAVAVRIFGVCKNNPCLRSKERAVDKTKKYNQSETQ